MLIEVLISAVILMLAVMGYSSSYVQGRKFIANQRYYQSAVQLTCQKMEEIKSRGYSMISIGEEEEIFELFGKPCIRHCIIELASVPSESKPQPCKKVTVITSWINFSQDSHEVKLITFVSP